MKPEQAPTGDALDIGLRMGSACLWFAALLPIGFLVSVFFVAIFG